VECAIGLIDARVNVAHGIMAMLTRAADALQSITPQAVSKNASRSAYAQPAFLSLLSERCVSHCDHLIETK